MNLTVGTCYDTDGGRAGRDLKAEEIVISPGPASGEMQLVAAVYVGEPALPPIIVVLSAFFITTVKERVCKVQLKTRGASCFQRGPSC